MNSIHLKFKSLVSAPLRLKAAFDRQLSSIGARINARFQHVASWSFEQAYRDKHVDLAKKNRAKKREEKQKQQAEAAERRAHEAALRKKRLEVEAVERGHRRAQSGIASKVEKELTSYAQSAGYFYKSVNFARPAPSDSTVSQYYNGVPVKYYIFDRSDLTDDDFKLLIGLDAKDELPKEEKIWSATPYLAGISRGKFGNLLQSINNDVNQTYHYGDMTRTELVVSRRQKQIYANRSEWVTELLLVHVADVERPRPNQGLHPR